MVQEDENERQSGQACRHRRRGTAGWVAAALTDLRRLIRERVATVSTQEAFLREYCPAPAI